MVAHGGHGCSSVHSGWVLAQKGWLLGSSQTDCCKQVPHLSLLTAGPRRHLVALGGLGMLSCGCPGCLDVPEKVDAPKADLKL